MMCLLLCIIKINIKGLISAWNIINFKKISVYFLKQNAKIPANHVSLISVYIFGMFWSPSISTGYQWISQSLFLITQQGVDLCGVADWLPLWSISFIIPQAMEIIKSMSVKHYGIKIIVRIEVKPC